MSQTVRYAGDGKPSRASADDVAAAWQRFTSRIPVQYALGTAKHESSFATNEIDTEDSGFVSKGIFQVSDGEAATVAPQSVDLTDLVTSCRIFAALSEKRLDAIIAAANLNESDLPDDVWPYLVIAHNQGLGAAEKTISLYGLNWNAYKLRNANTDLGQRTARYGDDVIPSGPSAMSSDSSQDDNEEPDAETPLAANGCLVVVLVGFATLGAAALVLG